MLIEAGMAGCPWFFGFAYGLAVAERHCEVVCCCLAGILNRVYEVIRTLRVGRIYVGQTVLCLWDRVGLKHRGIR